MRYHHHLISVALGLSLSCVPSPKKSYTVAEVGELASMDEIMRVKALYADPLFSIRDNEAFTDDQFADIMEAAGFLEATSTSLHSGKLSEGQEQGFRDIAGEMKAEAAKLHTAGDKKDAAAAGAALSQIKAQCGRCHSDHR